MMIDILMATYNGEKYVSEQIESIINQTYSDWKLFIRDDGSKDNTLSVIKEYANKYPEKIVVIEDGKRGLGAKLNFAELMKYSKNDYCMFADQDDFWINEKIQLTFDEMKRLEEKYSKNTPILVHTDLKVVDSNLNILNESFWEYQKLDANKRALNNLLVQNNITGCTMMMNRKLMEMSTNIPQGCIMHDWWIGLVASCFGQIGIVNKQTMLYRQHGGNEVGAHNYKSLKYYTSKLSNVNKITKSINDTLVQAKSFYDVYKNDLTKEQKNTLIEFYSLKDKGLIGRKASVVKNKFYKNGLARNIGYFIFI
ncbi:Chondroitin polymerase [uncultured Clostridium sp.]|nr:Chondroitin polymerase [uncultured Clostridium sp.]